jgi:hypothetical protein
VRPGSLFAAGPRRDRPAAPILASAVSCYPPRS